MSWESEVNKLEEQQVKQVEKKREVEQQLEQQVKQQVEELKLKERVRRLKMIGSLPVGMPQLEPQKVTNISY